MLKAVAAGLVAGLVMSSPVLAQRAAETDGVRAERARLSADDRQALIDARVAALRTGLRLTPEQEKNWPAVEDAIRELARQRAQAAAQWRESRQRRTDRDPIERLRGRAETMSKRAEGLQRLADAAEPLYRSLDDGQRRRLRVLTGQAIGHPFMPRRH